MPKDHQAGGASAGRLWGHQPKAQGAALATASEQWRCLWRGGGGGNGSRHPTAGGPPIASQDRAAGLACGL